MGNRNWAINSSSAIVRTIWTLVIVLVLGLAIGYAVVHFNLLYIIAAPLSLVVIVVAIARPNWGILGLIGSTFAISVTFNQLTNYNLTVSDFLVLALGIGLFTSSAIGGIKLRFSYVFPLLIMYLAVAFLSSLESDVLDFYLPRLVQFSEFGFAAFLFIQLRDTFNWKSILFVLTLGGSLTSVYSIYYTIFVTNFSKNIDMFNGNSFAFLLDLTLPVGLTYSILFFRDPIIKWLLPFTIVMLIGDLATFSRGSYTGLIIGAVVIVILVGLIKWLRIVPILFILFLVVVNLAPDKAFDVVINNKSFVDSRSYIWNVSLELFFHNPVIGIGVNKLLSIVIATPEGPIAVGDPHNFVLRLLLETGIFGFAFVLGIIILGLWRTYINFRAFSVKNQTLGWAAMNLGMLGGLVAYLVHCLFDVFWVRGSGLLFWLYIGLAYALAAKYLETKNQNEKELDKVAG